VIWLSVHGFNSIVRHTERTNAVRAINSTVLYGVKRRATRESGVDHSVLRIQSSIRATERLLTSTEFKPPPSLIRMKPIRTYSDIRARSVRPRKFKECRADPGFLKVSSRRGARLCWSLSIARASRY